MCNTEVNKLAANMINQPKVRSLCWLLLTI